MKALAMRRNILSEGGAESLPGRLLWFCQQQLLHLQVHGVRPAEADHVFLVSRGNMNLGAPCYYVILLAHSPIFREAPVNGGHKGASDAKRIVTVAIGSHSLRYDQIARRPTIGLIPLHSAGLLIESPPARS